MSPVNTSLVRSLAPLVVALLTMLGWPARTGAHCISDDQPNFDPGPIPVFISTDTGSGLRYVGLGDDGNDVEVETRWVKAAIDIINSSSADTPRLYFAGYDSGVGQYDQGVNTWAGLNPGITINAYSCFNYPAGSPDGGGGIAHTWFGPGIYDNRALISFIRSRLYDNCQNLDHECDWQADPHDPECHAFYVDPDDRSDVGGDYDFVGVMVHEMLHALGLNHTDFNLGLEWNSNCQNSYDPAVGSVMNTDYSTFSIDWRHRLRRDDIEGLRELYGEPQRQVYAASSTQTIPTSWSSSTSLTSIVTNTPAGLTSQASPHANYVWGSFTNTSDRLRYFVWHYQNGWYASNYAVYASGTTPITTHEKTGVSAGYPISSGQPGPLRLLFSWVGGPDYAGSGEDVMDADLRVWYRIWNGSTWANVASSGYTTYKNFGVAYDPNEDYFILAYADTYPVGSTDPEDLYLYVKTFNATGGGGYCYQAFTTLPDVRPYEIGDIACDFEWEGEPTRCTIPVSSLSDDGPLLQFVEGTIGHFSGYTCFIKDGGTPLTITDTYSYGQIGATHQSYDPIVFGQPSSGYGDHLVAYVPGFTGTTPGTSGYSRTLTMERNYNGLLGTIANDRTWTTNYWPVRVGSRGDNSSPYNTWWVLHY